MVKCRSQRPTFWGFARRADLQLRSARKPLPEPILIHLDDDTLSNALYRKIS